MADKVLGMRTVTRPYWTCRRCGYRNLREHVNCRGSDCDARRPKKPTRAHRRILQGDTYPLFNQANADIHGVTDESCGVCGKPRTLERKNDRDHDHLTGNPRGLACPGNSGCNIMMLPWIDSPTAYAIARAKYGTDEGRRWKLIGDYLARVEAHYGAAV